MTLSSPDYPKWYKPDGMDNSCEWQISAPEGFITALEFKHFKLDEGSFVSLYDGVCDETKELVENKLTGAMPNDDKWSFSSSGHHMYITFRNIYLLSAPGFIAKIHYGKELNDK